MSSTEAVPVEQFLKLSQEQHRIQHSGEYTHPKWFIPNTLKYYVLLHDMSEGDEQRYWKKILLACSDFCSLQGFVVLLYKIPLDPLNLRNISIIFVVSVFVQMCEITEMLHFVSFLC